MIRRNIISTQYNIPISAYVFDCIIVTDMTTPDTSPLLKERLEDIEGIYDVNYNMYMGDYIFFSIGFEYDNDDILDLIANIIYDYVGESYVY